MYFKKFMFEYEGVMVTKVIHLVRSDKGIGSASTHAADFDTATSMMLHIVQISQINDQTVLIAIWGTTTKNATTVVYRPVQILESSLLSTTKPRRGLGNC